LKYTHLILIALTVACVRPGPQFPLTSGTLITEDIYRSASRHCHSKTVIRMRPGVSNVFYVSGLADAHGKPAGEAEAKRIECVRVLLSIPRKDVWIIYS
jgi:hypothetical protein